MQLNIKETKRYIKHQFNNLIKYQNTGSILFLEGRAGIGKTAVQAQIAKELSKEYKEEVQLLTVNLSAKEAQDYQGLPYIEDGITKFAHPQDIPTEGKGILFFDEMNRVTDLEMKAVLLNLLNDREINGHKLGDGWLIVAAGNLFDSEEYDTIEFDTALKDRVNIFEFRPETQESINHLSNKYPDHFLIDCLSKNEDLIVTSGKGISPRRFEYAIKDTRDLDELKDREFILQILEGVLGDSVNIIRSYLEKKSFIKASDVLNRTTKLKKLEKDDHAVILYLAEACIHQLIKESTVEQITNFNKFLFSISKEALLAFWKLTETFDVETSTSIQSKKLLSKAVKDSMIKLAV
jgi:hypothetical protein